MKKEMEILKLNFKILEMIEGKVSGFQSITFRSRGEFRISKFLERKHSIYREK
jgi:hypothetical protein